MYTRPSYHVCTFIDQPGQRMCRVIKTIAFIYILYLFLCDSLQVRLKRVGQAAHRACGQTLTLAGSPIPDGLNPLSSLFRARSR